jgi:hypothetical protein
VAVDFHFEYVMPQLTIPDLDQETMESLRVESERRGIDVGSAAAALIRERLLQAQAGEQSSERLAAMAGTWSESDFAAFQAAVAPFESIDADLWK